VTGKARDVLYGRQGGGWLPDTPARPVPAGYQHRAVTLDRFHPVTRAKSLAHTRDRLSCPANDQDGHVADCTCEPSTAQLEAEWQGQARMAKARRDAGARLTAVDLQALDRYPDPLMTGADQ
jgi:hypothetical protein